MKSKNFMTDRNLCVPVLSNAIKRIGELLGSCLGYERGVEERGNGNTSERKIEQHCRGNRAAPGSWE